jgi:hypothetical protein
MDICMVERWAASQIASAFPASFFWRSCLGRGLY